MDTNKSLQLYIVSFVQDNSLHVVVLHAYDFDDVEYCIREPWVRATEFHAALLDEGEAERFADLQVGVMLELTK